MTSPLHQWEANFVRSMEQRRLALGMTQTDLAKKLRSTYGLPFHQQTVQRVEAGERPVRLNEAHCVALILGSSLTVMTADTHGTAEDVATLIGMLHDELRDRSIAIVDGLELHVDELASLRDTILRAWQSYERQETAAGREPDTSLGEKVRDASTRYDRFMRGIALLNDLADL
ncbi:MAG: helix-turn-helix domain-containing protein [Ornithinimicrobium sp.]